MGDRSDYYQAIRALALAKRRTYGVETTTFNLRKLRQIYSAEAIVIDIRSMTPRIKAIYMCADGDYSVAIRQGLPEIPKLFALVHELKHHWADREPIYEGVLTCGGYNENALISAEVFAAEFIYPEDEFVADIELFMENNSLAKLLAEDVVHYKRNGCRAKVSYTFIRKRLERLGRVAPGEFQNVQFQKLEEKLYGLPIYKQSWFVARRKGRM
jgi:Zn-dependent peptidase ImmA (M78 family)